MGKYSERWSRGKARDRGTRRSASENKLKQSCFSAPGHGQTDRSVLEMPLELIREEQAVSGSGSVGWNFHQYDTTTTNKNANESVSFV